MERPKQRGRFGVIAGVLATWMAIASPVEAQTADDTVAAPVVETDALDALKRMGAHLRTLEAFEVTAETTQDEIAETGENVEYASRLTIKARRPDRLRIDVTSDRNQRQYFYDGATVVIHAPTLGAYARFDGAPTIRETLEIASADYDLELPLADLFVWGTEDDGSDEIVDAFSVGASRINGEDCEHYVYRQEGTDWQIWVRTGAAPLPCRLVITATDEESRPRYAATLDWNVGVAPADEDFVFTPTDASYEIRIEPASSEEPQ